MAKRYGVLPSDFLKLKPDEFQFNLFVASNGASEEHRQAMLAQKKARSRGR
jgi:hypothetical protein